MVGTESKYQEVRYLASCLPARRGDHLASCLPANETLCRYFFYQSSLVWDGWVMSSTVKHNSKTAGVGGWL